MSQEVKIGLIGAGKWGVNYINTIKNTKGVSIKKIACKSLAGKESLLRNFEITNNWHEVITSSVIDGIIIASPPETHYEIAAESIRNSKPVIIEKPLTLDLKEAKLLLELQEKYQTIVKVNHVYLYHPLYRLLKKKIKDKVNLKSIYSLGGNYGPFRKDVSSLWDWGPHDLSMCLEIIGEYPSKIKAEFEKKENKDGVKSSNLKLVLDFKSRKYAEIHIGNLMQNKNRFLKVNLEGCSYIFDPINYKEIKEIRDFKVSSFAKSIKNDDLLIDKSPLEILINEFKDDICSGNSSPNDLNLAVNIVDILKKVDEILKDQ
jgi:predicted dehydrogenase